MGRFTKRFDYRNHVQGQLVTASEILEMQKMQYQTYCDIEADRFGLNPDGSFTPHVISGLTPRIDATARNIIIGRGHGWVTKTGTDLERQPIIVGDDEITVPVPEGDATHPRWLHILLYNPTANLDEAYGNATVATKDVNNILRNVSTPIYVHSVTSAYYTILGDPLATPECPVVTNLNMLPIATIYIPANDTGVIDAADFRDVRWFAPGFGNINYTRVAGETTFTLSRSWKSLQQWTGAPSETLSGGAGVVCLPSKTVFPLIPNTAASIYGGAITSTDYCLLHCALDPIISALTSPFDILGFTFRAIKPDGSGSDLTVELPKWISIDFNLVV